LKLDQKFQSGAQQMAESENIAPSAVPEKRVRKEHSALPMPAAPVLQEDPSDDFRRFSGTPIRTFESELDPYQLSLLDSGQFVMFRNVWRDGQRYIQGMLIAQQPFLQDVINAMFHEGTLSGMSDLLVAYRGDVLSVFNSGGGRSYFSGSEEFHGSLLFQKTLYAPLHGLNLIFTVTRLPSGAGGSLILWTSGVLLLVLCGGFLLMYRLGVGQIELARQQQDFVSAVSHELKTPLTSIRMYGEMLMEGWVSEEKRQATTAISPMKVNGYHG
jgi:signal transduction histidine kinase